MKTSTFEHNTALNTQIAKPFFSSVVQRNLTVNQPGDEHEREADAMADQVMRMKNGDAPLLQRMPITPVSSLQRACAGCEQERREEKEGLQRKETSGGDASGKAAPSIVSDVLSSGGGQPMDGVTQQFMESRFGQDFSQVRIHTDSRAAESASAIQARAYTSGRDVVFGKGEYQPESESGQRLLAHELVHVGQQGVKNHMKHSLQRFEFEGPVNYNDPVHENITLESLRQSNFARRTTPINSSNIFEFQRGVIWNDDPEGLVFDNNSRTNQDWSTGIEWVRKYYHGEGRANKGERIGIGDSLTERTHFGDLQFIHGMASQNGELAAVTKAKIMRWAEFTYKVGIQEIPERTLLKDIPVQGIPTLFNTHNLRNRTIRQLFHVHASGSTRRRAIGSLLHMIQDSFAHGHVQRERVASGNSRVISFHSYTNQDKGEHNKRDSFGSDRGSMRQRLHQTPGADEAIRHGTAILNFYRNNRPWEKVREYLDTQVFGLVNPIQPGDAGAEFERQPYRTTQSQTRQSSHMDAGVQQSNPLDAGVPLESSSDGGLQPGGLD